MSREIKNLTNMSGQDLPETGSLEASGCMTLEEQCHNLNAQICFVAECSSLRLVLLQPTDSRSSLPHEPPSYALVYAPASTTYPLSFLIISVPVS